MQLGIGSLLGIGRKYVTIEDKIITEEEDKRNRTVLETFKLDSREWKLLDIETKPLEDVYLFYRHK